MTNAVTKEILAIFGDPNHILAPAYTPRVQGMVERGHQVVSLNLSILLNEVCRAFPQEWSSLIPAVEYLYFTAPQGSLGFSARDMTMGYSMAQRVCADLSPFQVPEGAMETDFAIRAFDNFAKLYPIFVRVTQEERFRTQMRINSNRHSPHLKPGDMVFRKMPKHARQPKKLLYPASEGPFFVVKQKSPTSAILRDSEGNLVDRGENIPLTQIVLGPRQDPIVFEDRDDVRSTGEMIANPSSHGGKSAKRAGQRIGWTSLHANAFVLYRARFAPPEAAASNGTRKKLLLLQSAKISQKMTLSTT